jgi:hypothetical protein
MKKIKSKLLLLVILIIISTSNSYSQSWNHYEEDNTEIRSIKIKGTSYEYLFPEGIPIEAEITNDEDGYYFKLTYIWYGTNFDGPVDIYSTDLDISIFIKTQNGKVYTLQNERYYTKLRVDGKEQSLLDDAFSQTGMIYFIVQTKATWSNNNGTTKKIKFSVNSLGY